MSNLKVDIASTLQASAPSDLRPEFPGEAELYLITDGLPVIIAYIDQNQHFLFSNKAHQEHWGKTHAQIIGQHVKNILGEDNFNRSLPYLERALAGEHTTFEMTVNYTSQGPRYAKTDYVPHIDKNRVIAGCFVLSQDLTDKKNAEEERLHLIERFRRLVETTKVIPWEADINSWMFTYVGPQAFEILGYQVEEWYKPNFWVDHIHPDDRNSAIKDCMENSQIKDKFEFEYRMIAANNSTVWFRDIVSVFSNSDGIQYLQGFLVDITESKKAELEKLELEKKLRHSQKMEALGTLAGGIAHDFNNILGGIIGYSELALSKLPDESSLHNYVSQVNRSAYRAKDLVGQILSFSQKSKLASRVINLQKVIEEVLAFAKSTLPTAVQIITHWPDQVATIRADSSQIHQVLLNICTNAAHAMQLKGGLLDVALDLIEVYEQDSNKYHNLRPGHYVRVTIRDTGHGMSDEVRKRIFEPYYTTKKMGQGSGLGLSVAHGIIASHGGTITVWSAPEKGSQFSIYLPRVFEAVSDSDKLIPLPAIGKGNILFIDDEPVLAQLGKDMLESLGYTVNSFTSSREALTFFQKYNCKIELIITDRTMPNISGENLISEFKKVNPLVPAIICSGYSANLDKEMLAQIGACALLSKPFSLAELSEATSQALKQKQITC